MRKLSSGLSVTDQFCGAGGSSQGVKKVAQYVPGLEVKLALNHWKLAIETHNTNFPDTLHDCTDISACNPRRYPTTDILITSPECTNQTGANGKKKPQKQFELFIEGLPTEAEERSRATMWDVPRFAEYHKYKIIIVENVVEANVWICFDAWLMAMNNLGYNHKCVFANSMFFHPTPQSRDRMYVVFWLKGNPAPDLEYKPTAYCPECSKDVSAIQVFKRGCSPKKKYKTQYTYRCPVHGVELSPYHYAAANIIDWSKPGRKISDIQNTTVPLKENTLRRVQAALNKYSDYPLFKVNESTPLVAPFILNNQHSTGVDCRIKHGTEALNSIISEPNFSLLTGYIIQTSHTHAQDNGKIKHLSQPLQTQDTRQTMGLVVPYITELKKNGHTEPVGKELSTITAGAVQHSLTYYYSGSDQTSSMFEPVGTISTNDRIALTSWTKPTIEDCYYRTLKAHEIKLGMAFDKDYIILGNGKEQVKQCGNAVTPPVMEWLVGQCVKTLM